MFDSLKSILNYDVRVLLTNHYINYPNETRNQYENDNYVFVHHHMEKNMDQV
jgi:hypothetical protein